MIIWNDLFGNLEEMMKIYDEVIYNLFLLKKRNDSMLFMDFLLCYVVI